MAAVPLRCLFAEFLGTFLLVFAVGCNVLTGSGTWAVLSIAMTLMVCIYALADVSGANLNPAVSIALGLVNRLGAEHVVSYIAVQMLAGLLAGAFFKELFGGKMDLAPGSGYTWFEAGLVELIYTAMLCFVVLNCCASKLHKGTNEYYGLAIALTVVSGGYAGGHISGGCFNPAVALAVDLNPTKPFLGLDWFVFYALVEILGAGLAAVLFVACRPDELDGQEPDYTTRYPWGSILLSEFLGTYMLVLTVGLNVLGGSTAPVLSIAASLIAMILSVATVSGAHLNPAVTVTMLCTAKPRTVNMVEGQSHSVAWYIIAQMLAGICAGLTYRQLETDAFPLLPGAAFGIKEACFYEMVFTFLLCFVVLNVTQGEPNDFAGFAIGACVLAGGLAIGAVSGGSLNPAVSLGVYFSYGVQAGFSHGVQEFLAYVLAEVCGGCLAAVVFFVTSSKAKLEPDGVMQSSSSPVRPA